MRCTTRAIRAICQPPVTMGCATRAIHAICQPPACHYEVCYLRYPCDLSTTSMSQWGVLLALCVQFVIYHVRGRMIFTPTFVLSVLLLISFS